jgi:hypothetical protein
MGIETIEIIPLATDRGEWIGKHERVTEDWS